MRLLSYLLVLVITISGALHPTAASWCQEISPVPTLQGTAADPTADSAPDTTHETDMPSDTLDEILKKETHSEGLIQNILGGLALCYNVLANLLLYPIFSFLLLLLSLGIVILIGFWIKKIKDDRSIPTTWILFTCLYLLFYLDLFLVVYQKREVLFLFLALEKDLFLTVAAAFIGYVVGKFFSSKSFEEKELP